MSLSRGIGYGRSPNRGSHELMKGVSVITAAFNAAGVIERNIQSVAAQSLVPTEHIIVDDGSVDDTVRAVERLSERWPHLRLVRQKHGGAARARNAGIEAAQGRYVAFLDADDTWTKPKLEAQVSFMSANQVLFSYGDYRAMDVAANREIGRYTAPDHITHAQLLRGCPIGCLTAAYDQSQLGKRYMPDVRRGQDWGLWLELTRDGTVARRYPGCHATYFRVPGSLSSRKLAKAVDIYRIYRRHEHLGRLRSLRYLLSHILTAFASQPDRNHRIG